MSPMDIERFNADWLQAWTDKDVDRLVAFYSPNTVYKDPQTAHGLTGREALRGYLETLFGSTPPMVYTPDTTWHIDGGFCGRWTLHEQSWGRRKSPTARTTARRREQRCSPSPEQGGRRGMGGGKTVCVCSI